VRSGRRLAVDVGKVRVGLAISDFHGILASPLQNVARKAELEETIAAIFEAISDEDIIEIYVGLPVAMSGSATAALEAKAGMLVRMIDERLTTVSATAALRSSGKSSKDGRKVIDQIAATLILEQALNIEKNTGAIPGTRLADLNV
jgi:putative holliday junction resolvase